MAERSRKGFALTEAGEKLLGLCQSILSEYQKTKEHIQSLKGKPQGDVVLGTNVTLGLSLFVPEIPKIRAHYPQLKVHLHIEPNSAFLVSLLNEGKIDVACIDQQKPLANWLFEMCSIKPTPFKNYLYVNNGLGVKEYVLKGLGISVFPTYFMKKEIKDKKVQMILPKQCAMQKKDYLCCLETRKDFPKIAAVMNYFQKAFH